jgi:hypothetical protein
MPEGPPNEHDSVTRPGKASTVRWIVVVAWPTAAARSVEMDGTPGGEKQKTLAGGEGHNTVEDVPVSAWCEPAPHEVEATARHTGRTTATGTLHRSGAYHIASGLVKGTVGAA